MPWAIGYYFTEKDVTYRMHRERISGRLPPIQTEV
jgi:hypothetical protein